MQRPTISLTTKIVFLVALVGLVFGLINAYAAKHVQRVETQYRSLLQKQLNAAVHWDAIRHTLAQTAITIQATIEDPGQILEASRTLPQLQHALNTQINALQHAASVSPEQLHTVGLSSQTLFTAIQYLIPTEADQKHEVATQTMVRHLTPLLQQLNDDITAMHAHSQSAFEEAGHRLNYRSERLAQNITFAVWICIALFIALTAWLAWRFLSHPIERLTDYMRSMRLRHYEEPAAYLNRRDEIGAMARALQQFCNELQEAHKLELALAEHEKNQVAMQLLQQLTTALPGAVFQLELCAGEQLRLRFISPQWVKLLGQEGTVSTDVATAALTIRNYDPQVTAASEKHFLQSARTLEPVDFESSITIADGTTRWIKTRANPTKQDNGNVIFHGVWLDVTKEIQQAQALKKAKAQAEQDAQARTVLQASISHEIRTPLNAILGMTQLILKSNLPEPQREQLTNVLRASQHLRGIVNEVLDFSKIDAGQLKLETTDFSLRNVVLDVVRMCQEEASKKGLALHHHIAPEVPDKLRGDPHRIAQILLNYVNNAIKFTAAGQVQIALQLAPSSTLHRVVLRASVTDTGPGIPADRIPLLFEAFQQADNSITRRFGGTGLGLAISRALAQLMGGCAGVESSLGKGSTFWFTAVVEPARTVIDTQSMPVLQSEADSSYWKDQRILVVDDNALNRAVAQGMLEAMGFAIEVAEDGVQALLKLQSVGPDYYSCVLMDIQMPHMDGITATKALRQLDGFAHLPIIAMTAHTGVDDVERTQAAGMSDHLSKPLLESALIATLHRWLSADGQVHAQEESTSSAAESPDIPPLFDASAIDALAELFPSEKLQQLLHQFMQDSLPRAHSLPDLVQQQNWQVMREQAHKLAGTAATFGLLRLGYWAQALSAALKQGDTLSIQDTVVHLISAAEQGVEQLQTYTAPMT